MDKKRNYLTHVRSVVEPIATIAFEIDRYNDCFPCLQLTICGMIRTGDDRAPGRRGVSGVIMNFWFCETCGKRLTELDLEAGKGRDKKLKGVYCSDCAIGVMTMEMDAIQIPQPPPQTLSSPTKPTSGDYASTRTRKSSDTFRRQESHAQLPSARSRAAAPRPAANQTILVAATVLILLSGAVVGSMIVRSKPPGQPIEPPTPVAPQTKIVEVPPPPPPGHSVNVAAATTTTAASNSTAPTLVETAPAAPVSVSTPAPMPIDYEPHENVAHTAPAQGNDTGAKVVSAPIAAAIPAVKSEIAPSKSSQSVQFRYGENGYKECIDVAISDSMKAEYNKFNGVTTRGSAAPYVWCANNFDKNLAVSEVLICFKDISIPKSSKLTSAQLVIVVDNYTAPKLVGRYVNVAWDPAQAGTHKFGWTNREPKINWSSPNGGADADVVPDALINFQHIDVGSGQKMTVNLDVNIVSKWLSHPTTNSGILLTLDGQGSRLGIHTSGDSKVESRPALILNYQ